MLDTQLDHNNWRVLRVEDDVVIEVPVPLAYVETVYRAGLPSAQWLIVLSCHVNKHRQRQLITVTKAMPPNRNAGHYRARGLDE